MSDTAVITKEPRIEVGMLDDRFLDREGIEAPPEPTIVEIDVSFDGGLWLFNIPNPVEGVSIIFPNTIHVSRPNAQLGLKLALKTSGYTFESPAVLWIDPPQRGYSTNPFGTQPINPEPDGLTAIIPNSTVGQSLPLQAPFALVLKSSQGHTVIVDPTIIDDPNT